MTTPASSKTPFTLAALALAGIVLASVPAEAALVVEEQFDYAAGPLAGASGGTGFDPTSNWDATSNSGANVIVVESPGLAFSTLDVAGNSVGRTGTAVRSQAHRDISVASQAALLADDTTIWFSSLYVKPGSAPRGAFLFGTEAFSTGSGNPTLAAAGDGFGFTVVAANGTSNGGTLNAIAYDNSTAPTVVVSTFDPGSSDPVLVAGKINWKANGTPDELFIFNVTDLTTEPLEGDAIASITTLDFDQSAFDTLGLFDNSFGSYDEIRFGNEFGDVVPVIPEPSAVALLGLGGLVLMRRRR